MIKPTKFYQALSLALVFTILSTLIPPRVWYGLGHQAAIAHAAANSPNPITQLLGPEGTAILDNLPPELNEQLGGLEMFTENGKPNGMLMDAGAIQALAPHPQIDLQQPQSLQNPLTLSRVQSAYSADAALDNTLIVTFTVSNNQLPVSVPEIDPQATVTETLEFATNLDFSNDPNTIHNILLTDELLPNVTTVLDLSQPSDRMGDNFAWNLGDLPPLSSLTISLTLQLPSSVLAFTELDTGAEVWGTLKGQAVSANTAPISLAPDGFAGWLNCTIDANCNDQYVIEKAAELGNDPVAIFEYVRSLGYESYKGSLRGARGALWSEAGNSIDQASLLIALLRASGVPASYRHGILEDNLAQKLILSMFPEPQSLLGHIPEGTETSDPANDLQLLEETRDHWWVQAYLPSEDSWVQLDPTFAQAQIDQTFVQFPSTEQLAELPDELRHKVTIKVKIEEYHPLFSGTNVQGLEEKYPLSHTFNTVELVGEPVNLSHAISSDFQGGAVFYNIQHSYVPYFTVGNSDTTIEGNTFQEMISNFPFGNLRVIAEWLEFEFQSPDGQVETAVREIIDEVGVASRQSGGQLNLSMNRLEPLFDPLDVHTMDFSVSKIPFNVLKTKLNTSVQSIATISSEIIQPDEAKTDTQTIFEQDITGNFIRSKMKFGKTIGYLYKNQVDTALSIFEPVFLNRIYLDSPRLVIVSNIATKGITPTLMVDLLKSKYQVIANPAQVKDSEFSVRMFSGMLEKTVEALAFERMGEQRWKSTSGVSILREAQNQNIPLIALTRDNMENLSDLDLSSQAKARIVESIHDNKLLLVPQREIVTDNIPKIVWWEVSQNGNTTLVSEDGQHSFFSYLSTQVYNDRQTHQAKFVAGMILGALDFVVFAFFTVEISNNVFGTTLCHETVLFCIYKDELMSDITNGFIHIQFIMTIIANSLIKKGIKWIQPDASFLGGMAAVYFLMFKSGGWLVSILKRTGWIDPPLPNNVFGASPNITGRALARNNLAVNANHSSSIATSIETNWEAINGSMDITWRPQTGNLFQFDTLSIPQATIYNSINSPVDSGAIQVTATHSNATAVIQVAPTNTTLNGKGQISLYSEALSGLGAGSGWDDYTAVFEGTSVYTLILNNVVITVENTNVTYTGDFIVTTTDITTIKGIGHTVAPNFANTVSMQTDNAQLTIGPAIGSVTLGGQTFDASNGLVLANYTGPITISEATVTTDRIELNGTASFFTLNLSPETIITDPNTPVIFQTNIEANFDDIYTMTVEAPSDWQVELADDGMVTATPPLGTAPGDYQILVTAQSGQYPDLFTSAIHTITTTAYQGLEMTIAPDPLITIPWGETKQGDLALVGDTNTGQIQIPGAAYTVDITNTSTASHTFTLTISGLPEGWLILSGNEGQSSTSLTLPPGGVGQIGFYVQPTSETLPPINTEYPFEVMVVATDGSGLSQNDSSSFIMPAIPFNYVTVEPAILYMAPDSSANFELTVENVGNAPQDFPIQITLPFTSWQQSSLNQTGEVAAGAAHQQTINLETVGATIGDEGIVSIDSFAPGTAYTQTAYVTVQIVDSCVAQGYNLAQETFFMEDDSLSSQLANLASQLERWQQEPTNSAFAERTLAALNQTIVYLQLHYPAVDLSALQAVAANPSLEAFCSATVEYPDGPLAEITNQLTQLGQRQVTAMFQPGVSASLPNQPVTYTLVIENKGRLETNYELRIKNEELSIENTLPVSVTLSAGQMVTFPVIMQANERGFYPFAAEIEAGPFADTDFRIFAKPTAGLNVVDSFVKVLAVTAEPPFVETGVSSTTLSVSVANIANIYQASQAQVEISNPAGQVVWSTVVPITIPIGNPQRHALEVVDTSGWVEGVYPIQVELLDGQGNLIPDGLGHGILGVGQAVQAQHGVYPAIVPPGTVTVTTMITTTVNNEVVE